MILERKMKNEKVNLALNRIGFLLAGALVTFAVLSITVISSANAEIASLTSALDTSQYEAGRLLSDGLAQYEAGDYAKAQETLGLLLTKQPGSVEAAEGKILITEVMNAASAANARWEAALPEIRAEWIVNKSVELRKDADAVRLQAENDVDENARFAWNNAIEDVHSEWESQQE